MFLLLWSEQNEVECITFFTATITVYQNPTLCPKDVVYSIFSLRQKALADASHVISSPKVWHEMWQPAVMLTFLSLAHVCARRLSWWTGTRWYLSTLHFRYKILNGTFSSINQNNTELLVIGPEGKRQKVLSKLPGFKPITPWNILDWGDDALLSPLIQIILTPCSQSKSSVTEIEIQHSNTFVSFIEINEGGILSPFLILYVCHQFGKMFSEGMVMHWKHWHSYYRGSE